MTNTQRAKLDSYNRIVGFNDKYAADLTTVEDYTDIEAVFNETVNSIIEAAGIQTQKPGTSDEAVTEAKTTMAETVVNFALRGSVKARLAGNTTLANQLDEPVSYIFRAPKTTAVQRATQLRNYMNDNLATLTNITAADITTMDKAIGAYNNMKDEPIKTRQSKKAGGTTLLPPLFEAADESADNMFSLVRSYFSSNMGMIEEMRLAMEVISTGIRHTSVQITAIANENDEVIPNATVTEKGSTNTYDTDEEGVIHIGSHRNGKFTFTISSPGRQSVVLTAIIVRGTDNEFIVKLRQM